MASKGQLTGMTGTFLVAAQLSLRGLVASTTSRGAAGADILVTDSECKIAYSIQVKTNSKSSKYWLLGNKKPSEGSKTHIFAFVNLIKGESDDILGEYYLVPSTVVQKIAVQAYADDPKAGATKKWKPFVISRENINKYRNKWDLFTKR